MKWKFVGDMPVYQQIVAIIRGAILSGELKPGDKVPSVRDLATAAMVNPNTMQRALHELELMRVIVTDGTNGRNITSDVAAIEEVRSRCIAELTCECVHRFALLGVSAEEAGRLLMMKCEEGKNGNSIKNG